jgi:hypothetical protein
LTVRRLPRTSRVERPRSRRGSRANQGFPALFYATPRLSARPQALLTQRLDPVLLVGALVGDKELAMRAFEALMAVGAAREELGLEGLLAVRTDDLVGRLLLGRTRHTARIAS